MPVTHGVASSSLVRTAFKSPQKIEGFFTIAMFYYVYIVYSKSLKVYYKGFTTDIDKRLYEHRTGLSRYTKQASDWDLFFFKRFTSKREALIYERKLKRQNQRYLRWLIASEENDLFNNK